MTTHRLRPDHYNAFRTVADLLQNAGYPDQANVIIQHRDALDAPLACESSWYPIMVNSPQDYAPHFVCKHSSGHDGLHQMTLQITTTNVGLGTTATISW